MSIHNNGKKYFKVHSSIINMKWTCNHIDPLGVEPSQLVQHKDYWKHEPTLVKKGRCVVTSSGTETRLQYYRL